MNPIHKTRFDDLKTMSHWCVCVANGTIIMKGLRKPTNITNNIIMNDYYDLNIGAQGP